MGPRWGRCPSQCKLMPCSRVLSIQNVVVAGTCSVHVRLTCCTPFEDSSLGALVGLVPVFIQLLGVSKEGEIVYNEQTLGR